MCSESKFHQIGQIIHHFGSASNARQDCDTSVPQWHNILLVYWYVLLVDPKAKSPRHSCICLEQSAYRHNREFRQLEWKRKYNKFSSRRQEKISIIDQNSAKCRFPTQIFRKSLFRSNAHDMCMANSSWQTSPGQSFPWQFLQGIERKKKLS